MINTQRKPKKIEESKLNFSLNKNNLLPYDGSVFLVPDFIASPHYMNDILDEVSWRDDKIKMFGKVYSQSRLVAWHGDQNIRYKYSNIEMISIGWTKTLDLVRSKLRAEFGLDFNSVLVNYYRHGEDYMSYHQDNEKELGLKPIIASISFGETRDFYFKHIKTQKVIKTSLKNGDCLIMKGDTQDFWKHSIPKRKMITQARLNLTFRNIL
jgi:alkylated DNA repair dioxygenase AlkB